MDSTKLVSIVPKIKKTDMAYKSKKKNKKHIEQLNKTTFNWRNVKRRENKISSLKSELREIGCTEEQIQDIINNKII